MVIIRAIFACVAALWAFVATVTVLPLAGLLTLYWGVLFGDWCEDQWGDLVHMYKEFFDTLKNFVLEG